MLKGKTRIELTDVKTGVVAETEDHNVVTAALNRVLKTYGVFNNSIFNITDNNIRSMPFWKKLLGGILLFEGEIPYLLQEGQDGYTKTCWPPASARMVANGSVLFNTVCQNPKEIGIFNENESGIQADGSIKLVYDWDTSHGNGTIGSVCLTSCTGGYEGYGNQSGEVESSQTAINSHRYVNCQQVQATNGVIKNDSPVIRADMDTGTVYVINGEELTNGTKFFKTTGILHIYKVQIMTNRLALAADINNIPYELYKTITIPKESLSKYVNTNYTATTDCKTGKTYITYGRYGMVLDNDFNMSEKDFGSSLDNSGGVSLAYDSRLYINKNAYNAAKVLDAETGATVKEFETGTVGIFGGVLCDGIIQASEFYNEKKELLIDTETFQYARTNRVETCRQKFFIENGLCFVRKFSGENYTRQYLELFKDGRYLATINNLSSPVTKTAEKTMKITYTIYEE